MPALRDPQLSPEHQQHLITMTATNTVILQAEEIQGHKAQQYSLSDHLQSDLSSGNSQQDKDPVHLPPPETCSSVCSAVVLAVVLAVLDLCFLISSTPFQFGQLP